MCGRYSHKFTWREIHDLLSTGKWPVRLAHVDPEVLAAKYNVAPSQAAPVVRATTDASGKVTGIEVVPLRWGLAPHWAKDPKTGPINARAETVATNGMFRAAFASRRCIVPVSGFYEWLRVKLPGLLPEALGGEPIEGPKIPHFISRADDKPMLLAGLWEQWGKKEECVETFAIITTSANAFMSQVHERMPVVLEPEAVERWLDPAATPAQLTSLLQPAADGVLQMHQVSMRVNNPKNQGEDLIAPV